MFYFDQSVQNNLMSALAGPKLIIQPLWNSRELWSSGLNYIFVGTMKVISSTHFLSELASVHQLYELMFCWCLFVCCWIWLLVWKLGAVMPQRVCHIIDAGAKLTWSSPTYYITLPHSSQSFHCIEVKVMLLVRMSNMLWWLEYELGVIGLFLGSK